MAVAADFMVAVLLCFIYQTKGWVCEDLEPCTDYITLDRCSNPGIPHHCMKTCGACLNTPQGPACTEGHILMNNECRPCSEQSFIILMTRRECPQNCPPGNWGSDCTITCNPGCFSGRCERWSGRCISGCLLGLYGSHCSLHCENCLDGQCTMDGECTQGCVPGFRGNYCLQDD